MKFSEKGIKTLSKIWSSKAKEEVEVIEIGSTLYAFCSEIAALRLAYHYMKDGNDEVVAEYSENLETWFFRLDLD